VTPLHPDKCEHGIETYLCTVYGKDMYLLKSGTVLCIRYGRIQDRFLSVDISRLGTILHHKSNDCAQLAHLVRTVVQPRSHRRRSKQRKKKNE